MGKPPRLLSNQERPVSGEYLIVHTVCIASSPRSNRPITADSNNPARGSFCCPVGAGPFTQAVVETM